ncbi:MAG: hypothetical protein HC775_01735 [Hyellaceae cyanobacterium CSU_1_1]|nr:hypothetical protein [Hyellaceae cyanobacterium CSU_1_1]
MLPIEVRPQSQSKVSQRDPSEAADSENILPSLLKYFTDAQITNTGGAVYNTILADMLTNIDKHSEIFVLDLLMIIDELLAELGENQYATAIAIK